MLRRCWLALLLAAAACDEVIVAAAGVAEQLQGLSETNVSFTESLVQLYSQPWNRVINHRFTDELANGTLNLGVLRCYLVQDHRFLDSFVVLLSSMIAQAHSLKDRIPGAQFLGLITGKENTYFERSFEALGVTDAVRESTPSAPATRTSATSAPKTTCLPSWKPCSATTPAAAAANAASTCTTRTKRPPTSRSPAHSHPGKTCPSAPTCCFTKACTARW